MLTDRRTNASPFWSAGRNMGGQLSQDPTFRLISYEKTWDRGAALTSRLRTFETEMLGEQENFGSLARINRELIGKAEALDAPQRVVLDMDSTEIPSSGKTEAQAGSLVQGFSLPGGELEGGAASGGEGGVPLTGQAAGRLHPHAVPPAAEWPAGPSTAK